jgi:hypothetical protein
MLNRIFPKQFDNIYCGYWLGLWLLVPVILATLAIGTNSIINTRYVAMSADGLPLDRFTGGGAEAVIALFAIVGLFRVTFALLGIAVMLRYRAMIPFMYILLLILELGGKALIWAHPIVRSDVATAHLGSAFALGIQALTLVGFVFSLVRPRSQLAAEGAKP